MSAAATHTKTAVEWPMSLGNEATPAGADFLRAPTWRKLSTALGSYTGDRVGFVTSLGRYGRSRCE